MTALGRQLGLAVLVVLAALMLVAVPAAAASAPAGPVEPTALRVSLPISFSGAAVSSAADGLLHMGALEGADDALVLRVEAASAQVRVIEVTRGAPLVPDRFGLLERVSLGSQESQHVENHGTLNAVFLAMDGAPAGAFIQARMLEAGDATIGGETSTGSALLTDVPRTTSLSYRDNPGTHDHEILVYPGTFVFAPDGATSTLSGDFQLVLHGVTASLMHDAGHLDLATGTSTDAPDGPLPGLVMPGEVETTRYAVLDLTDASLSLRSASAEIYAPSGALRIAVDGKMSSPGLAGGVPLGSDIVHAAGDAAQMTGRFTVVPSGSGNGQTTLLVEGEVDTLTLGPQRFEPKADTVRQAAGIMVGLAAIGAAVWTLGKAGFVAPLYAKLTRRKILDQGTRNLIFLKIQQDPGVTTKTIAEELDISWSTGSYHLRVLRHMGLITARRRGRHEHHFVTGERSLGEQEIMAALRHPTTRSIARLVTREPGIIQKEICRRLGIAPSTASDHLKRLRDLGAVREVQDWRTRAYHPIEGLDRVASEVENPQGAAAAHASGTIVGPMASPLVQQGA